MAAVAAIATAVISAAATTNTVIQDSKQNHATKIAAEQQQTLLTKQATDAKNLETSTVADTKRSQDAATLQRQRAAAATGKSDTLLTTPSATQPSSAPGTGYKTLLGM